MLAMPDEKEILLSYIESERYEAAQEATKKAQEAAKAAIQEAERKAQEADKRIVVQMLKEGLPIEQIARCIPTISTDDIIKIQEELLKN